MLDEHLRFERLISDLSARFVNVSPDQIDGEIEHALKQVLEFFQVDRCGLLGLSPDRNSLRVTHAAYDEGIERIASDVDLARLFPWSHERLVMQEKYVSFSKPSELPPEAEQDRQSWTAMGVQSSLVIPLFFEGSVSSLIVIGSLRRQRFWPEEYIPRLRLLGEIFINALERRNADRALRESEARLSLATEAVGAGLWVMDAGNSRVWVSPKSRELFHFGPDEEIHYETYFRVIHPGDRDRVHQEVQRTLRSGETLNCDYRIVLPDGSIRWIVARGQRCLKSNGEPDRIMGLSLDITEHKCAEGALLASEERFRALAESALVGIYVLQDGKYAYVNPSMAHVFGYSVAEMTGMGPREIVQPDDYEMVSENIKLRITGEVQAAMQYEVRGRHKDGSTRDVEVYGTRMEISGRPALVGTLIDITERKRAETALEESRTQIAAVMNSTRDFIWSVDPERFGLLTWNRAFRDYFFEQRGIELEVGMTPEDLVPPDYVPLWHGLFSRALHEEFVVTEYVVVSQTITLLLSLYAMRRDQGTFGISVFGRDITELKAAEATRLENMARYQAVVEAFDGFIYICSQDYRVEFMNQRMIERTGRDAVGEICYKALHNSESVCEWCVNGRVLQGETVHWEVQSPKDHRWYYVVNTPIHHADGTMSKQAMIMDITERKLAEEAMKANEAALRNGQKDLQKLAGRLISAQEEELRRLSRELHDDLTQRLAVLA
ncbi:MAG: PAS domain S-box protein, partial [Thermodesulfovibrionales bacterium]